MWISHEVLWSAMRPRIAFADQLGKLLSDASRINQQMGNSHADPPLRSDVSGGRSRAVGRSIDRVRQ